MYRGYNVTCDFSSSAPLSLAAIFKTCMHWYPLFVFGLCCHLFARLVEILLQAAYRLTCGMQSHRKIHLGIPQTEMYSVKIKASKKNVVASIYTPVSKISQGVIHFKIYYGQAFMLSE